MIPPETGPNDGPDDFIFGPVLQAVFADEGMRRTAAFFHAFFKDVRPLPKERLLRAAAEKALKRFLVLFADELENAGAAGPELKDFIDPLADFLRDERTARILGSAFDMALPRPDVFTLRQIWASDFPPLPGDFDWSFLIRRYCREIRADLRRAPILKKTLQSGIDAPAPADPQAEEAADLARYREEVLARFSRFRPAWIPGYWLPENGLPLHDLFIPPLLREADPAGLDGDQEDPPRRLRENLCRRPAFPASVLFDDHALKHAVIIGPPGSGKSILLRRMALAWARTPLQDLGSLPVPVFTDIDACCAGERPLTGSRLLSHEDNLFSRLNEDRRHEYLKSGRILFLADGLNRIKAPAMRQKAVSALADLARTFPDVRIFITARTPSPALSALQAAGFRMFHLQPFDGRQMRDFADRWTAAFTPDAVQSERKTRMLRRRDAFGDPGVNPGMLALMTAMEAFPGLPDQRAECMADVTRLLMTPESGKDAPEPGVKDMQAVLSRIAEAMTFPEDAPSAGLISTQDMTHILCDHFRSLGTENAESAAGRLVSWSESHCILLQKTGGDAFSFVLPAFRDYFAARAVIRRFQRRGLADGMDLSALNRRTFRRHAADASCWGALAMTADMLDAGFLDEIIRDLLDRAGPEEGFTPVFLAAECLATARNSPELSRARFSTLHRLNALRIATGGDVRRRAILAVARIIQAAPGCLDWLKKQAVSSPDTEVREAAMAAIARRFSDDQEARSWLRETGASGETFEIRLSALGVLARSSRRAADVIDAMKSMLAWADSHEKAGVIRALARRRPYDPEIINLLGRAASSPEPVVREAALRELIASGRAAPNLPERLETGLKDDDARVRVAAVGGLAAVAGDDPDIQAKLAETALSDPSAGVQASALNALVCCKMNENAMGKVLKAACRSGRPAETRLRAMDLLSRLRPDDPDFLLTLKTAALSDPEPAIRTAAIKQMTDMTRDDPEVLSILTHAAVSDASIAARRAALSGLRRHWADHQDVTNIFMSAFEGRKQERLAALEAFSETPVDDHGLLSKIREMAETDDHAEVRAAAVRVLAGTGRHEPELAGLLKKAARGDANWLVRREAVSAVCRIIGNEPGLLDWLKQTAQTDDHWPVREAAIREIIRAWRNDPRLAAFLIERIKRDPFRHGHEAEDAPGPRQTALEALIMHFPDHPDVPPLLRELAEHDADAAIKSFAAEVIDFNLLIENR